MSEKLDLDALEKTARNAKQQENAGNAKIYARIFNAIFDPDTALSLIARIRELERASQPGSREVSVKLDGPVIWVRYDTSGLAFSRDIHVGEKRPEGERWQALYHVDPDPAVAARASLDGRGEKDRD